MASRIDTLRQELDTINKEHGFLLTDVSIADCYSKKLKERNKLEKLIQLANKQSQKQATTNTPTPPEKPDPGTAPSDRTATQTKKPRNYWKWDSDLGKLRGLTILTALLDLRTDDDQVR